MIQGTTSDAGKSTLVAGLCRVLQRRGVRVAPFKPQNMALNSAVTADGGEIGRAQAVQAQACGLEPHSDMNPVLLKPNSEMGAQVIIHGKALANMDARAYHDYKTIAMRAVLESYARLRAQYDVIIVEGAGSPAEINLRDKDIANMGFAEAIDCPVLIIADIDRGGVFAHLVGTLALLSESEQARVAGFVINRFRGDLALLMPGVDWLSARTGKPTLGVLPYLHGMHLEAEDALPRTQMPKAPSVSEQLKPNREFLPPGRGKDRMGVGHMNDPHPNLPPSRGKEPVFDCISKGEDILAIREGKDIQASLRIIVLALPRISNHTDFDALRLHPQVDFHYIGPGQDIPAADLIILPGSKSVRADLAWLRAQGWDHALLRHLRYGGKVLGICGGFQMLGQKIHDPHGLEGVPGSTAGLQLLDVVTTLAADKQLRRVNGVLAFEHAPVTGYEIHHGVTEGSALQRPLVKLNAHDDGVISSDEQIIGTYLHGLFDAPPACAALLRWAGLRAVKLLDYPQLREQGIDRIADTLEQHLDLKRINVILGISGS